MLLFIYLNIHLCVHVGELWGSCGGAVSPVPLGGPHPLLLGGGVTSSGRKKGPDLPNRAEVHKLSASQTSTGDHSIILFTVLYRAPVCAVPHLCIYTHIHQGFSSKPANCGLCYW